jgi:hypothetical protein
VITSPPRRPLLKMERVCLENAWRDRSPRCPWSESAGRSLNLVEPYLTTLYNVLALERITLVCFTMAEWVILDADCTYGLGLPPAGWRS